MSRLAVRIATRVQLPSLPSGVHGAVPDGARREIWDVLLDCATDSEAPEVQALAGVLATAYERFGSAVLPLSDLAPHLRKTISRMAA